MASTSGDVQQAFDADVQMEVADLGLYFVCAAENTHDAGANMSRSLRSVGAQIAARINDVKVLAVLSYAAFEQLRRDAAIGLVGPVALDAARFRLFQQVAGIGEGAPPSHNT